MEPVKTYIPKEIEQKWYHHWESAGYFKPTDNKNAPNYCIQLPPPNVTGTLHMGHGFQHTLQDALIRFHRMKGYNTLWQPGTDHAGIATQMVVERELEKQGLNRKQIGRESFTQKVWEWKEFSGGTITNQMRQLGASCDWSRERFTMDAGLSAAVVEVFITLHKKCYIYRGKRLVNWDVRRQTAVSDLEVVSVEEQGSMWHIRYPVKNSAESITIATTRPETMLGDVAVAVNPNDERYKHLIGKSLILPLVDREIPIIVDEYVDMEFGTGCVKITPAHDFNDYEIGKRHNLPQISILTLDGRINELAPQQYQGMERFAARKQIVADLEASGFLVEIKPHKLMVPRGERDDVVIEPMLTDQWFMHMEKLAADGLEVVRQGKVKFVPDNWTTIYNQWLENIQDWCISRQLWWGHRIPAYYDKQGNVYVAHNLEDAIRQAGSADLTQDPDVLDTWFSSALWSFSTLGWPDKTSELEKFLPSSVLVTGFDIIFFWVARMVMLTREFTGKVPFKDVYVTGLIQDAHGNKMSKSKGNIIDPIDLINGVSVDALIQKRTQFLMNPKQAESIAKQTKKDYPQGFMPFGADALRFTFTALATHGREIRFDIRRIEGARNFCNKIWNASRFLLLQVENNADLNATVCQPAQLSLIDNWILVELKSLIEEVNFAFSTYRFDILAQKLYEFIWNEYCDWYLELAKVNLQNQGLTIRATTLSILLNVFECILRITHPVMPFITEELWQVIAPLCNRKNTESIMLASYPSIEDIEKQIDQTSQAKATKHIKLLKEVISSIRNLRAEMGLNPAAKVPLVIEVEDNTIIKDLLPYITALAKLSQIEVTHKLNDSSAPVVVLANMRLMLQVEVDAATEKLRLTKEIEKLNKELDKIKVKLDNPTFMARAPQDLVLRDTKRCGEIIQSISQLHEQLVKLI